MFNQIVHAALQCDDRIDHNTLQFRPASEITGYRHSNRVNPIRCSQKHWWVTGQNESFSSALTLKCFPK